MAPDNTSNATATSVKTLYILLFILTLIYFLTQKWPFIINSVIYFTVFHKEHILFDAFSLLNYFADFNLSFSSRSFLIVSSFSDKRRSFSDSS